MLYLSRDIFPILETSVRKGLIFPKSFQEKKINYLREKTSSFQQHCYEVFYTWQDEYFLKNLYAKYKNILKSGTESVKEIFKSITDSDFKSFSDINLKINTISNKIEDKIKSLNNDLDNLVVKLVRETAIFKNKSFSEVNEYLGNLQKSVQTEMLSYKTDKDFDAGDDEDEDNENDDEKINTSSKDANHIFRNYVVASIKSLSRAYSQKKKISHKSLYYLVGKYINFDHIIDDKHKQEIASYVIQIALLKNFNKLQNRYISGLVSRYKIFRKEYASFYINDIDPKKIEVIYNGVSDDYFPTTDYSHYKEMGEYMVFVGSRATYKNFLYAVEAIATSTYKLVIVGDLLSSKENEYCLLKLGQKRFICVGRVSNENLNLIYNSACALLYPSFYEGFGIPVLEAQKAGCPVIAYGASSIPEIIGDTPLLLRELSISEFKRCCQILKDSTQRANIVARGIKNAQRFTWDKMYLQYLSLYKKVSVNK